MKTIKVGNTEIVVAAALAMGKKAFIEAHKGILDDPEAAWAEVEKHKPKSEK